MAAKKPFIKLKCSECDRVNYFTHKSKKFCKWCRKHTVHKETKK